MKHPTTDNKNLQSSTLLANQGGFTMLEVLVNIVLLTVGILGVLSSVNSVMHYQRHSKDMTLATMHATNKLEEIKRVATNEPTGGAFGFDYFVDVGATGFLNGYVAADDWTRTSTDNIDGYARTWTISVFIPGGGAQTAAESFIIPGAIRMIQAVVTTTWVDAKGNTKSVDVGTVLARRQFIGS